MKQLLGTLAILSIIVGGYKFMASHKDHQVECSSFSDSSQSKFNLCVEGLSLDSQSDRQFSYYLLGFGALAVLGWVVANNNQK